MNINLTQQIHDKAIAMNVNDLINLAIGYPCENINEILREETIKAIKNNSTTYCQTEGIPELREIITKNRVRFNSKDNIIITAGASEAIFLVISNLINKGDEVIIISPTYFIFPSCVKFNGGKTILVPLEVKENKFNLSLANIEKKITDKTKLIIFNSPHNPTGFVPDKQIVYRLAQIVDKYNLILLSDEIYKDYIYEGEFQSPEEFTDRVIVVDGISKSFLATGLRIGWIITRKNIIKNILPLHQLILFCSPSPFQYGVYDMIKQNVDQFLKKHIETYREKKDKLLEILGSIPELEIIEPQGTFYAFVKLKININSIRFSEELLLKKHVVVVPGLDYGKEWNNYFRLAFREPLDKIEEGCIRIKDFIEQNYR